MKLAAFPKKICGLILPVFLMTIPAVVHASEGPAWIYMIMAPFALFSIPFFMTTVFLSIAAYCYWRYRTMGKKWRGILAVLVLLLAIPIAFRDKASYVAFKYDQEMREHNRLMAEQRRTERRAGKHVSPDFKAMSTAYAAKYYASGKTETDRLNFQAGRDMVQMARAIDSMQQKEPVATEPPEEAPPVRSFKTLLFELYAFALLLVTGLAGAVVARWRGRRNLTPMIHLAPLFICVYMPVIASLPFMAMFDPTRPSHIYFSRFGRITSSQLPFIFSYLIGLFFYLWRVGGSGMPARNPGVLEPALQPSAPEDAAFDGDSGAGQLSEENEPLQAKAGKVMKLSWKKIMLSLAALLLANWLVQTLLMNALFILGSHAEPRFRILPPQSLLPLTMPTYVSFLDKASGKPLAGTKVRVTWEYNDMGILPETEARYADQVYTTDEKGKIFLQPRLKPYKTYLFAFYHSFNHGIFLFLDDPRYLPASDRPYEVPRIQGEHLSETVSFNTCRTPEDWNHALGQSNMHSYSYLKNAIDGLVRQVPLDSIPDSMLNDLSERCMALVTPTARQVDEELVRRGPQRVYTESYILALIRLGRTDEAVAALPLLAGRPYAEEWQEHFRKFLADLEFEKELVKEAAPLIASGKNADQLHEEGLNLHKQQKQRQALPYYQAAITLAPQSSRFHNNYAVAVTDLMHYFFAEKLCRKSIANDPKRANAYMALGRVLIPSNRNLEAYLLLKEALRLGYNDTFTWSNLAIVADNLKFTKEARAAVKEARKLDPKNPDLARFRHLELNSKE